MIRYFSFQAISIGEILLWQAASSEVSCGRGGRLNNKNNKMKIKTKTTKWWWSENSDFERVEKNLKRKEIMKHVIALSFFCTRNIWFLFFRYYLAWNLKQQFSKNIFYLRTHLQTHTYNPEIFFKLFFFQVGYGKTKNALQLCSIENAVLQQKKRNY